MREFVLETSILPEPLLSMIRSEQMRVKETGDGFTVMPFETKASLEAIKKARGMYKDGKLSVDRFLAERREEEGY